MRKFFFPEQTKNLRGTLVGLFSTTVPRMPKSAQFVPYLFPAQIDQKTKEFSEKIERFQKVDGGEGGIRTHGTLSRTAVFKTAALNHSATSPEQPNSALAARLPKPFPLSGTESQADVHAGRGGALNIVWTSSGGPGARRTIQSNTPANTQGDCPGVTPGEQRETRGLLVSRAPMHMAGDRAHSAALAIGKAGGPGSALLLQGDTNGSGKDFKNSEWQSDLTPARET
jgi:hypothetical protein